MAIIAIYSRYFQSFTEGKGSLPRSAEPNSISNRKPVKPTPHSHFLFSVTSIFILSSHLPQGVPSSLFYPDRETNIFYGKHRRQSLFRFRTRHFDSQTGFGANQSPTQWEPGALFPRGKVAEARS